MTAWQARRDALPALAKLKPTCVLEDATVPRSKIPAMIAALGEISKKFDLTIGTWRGLGAPKNTPPEVMAKLREITAKTAAEQSLKDVMDKQNLGYVYTDGATFKDTLAKDDVYFKELITKLNIKP